MTTAESVPVTGENRARVKAAIKAHSNDLYWAFEYGRDIDPTILDDIARRLATRPTDEKLREALEAMLSAQSIAPYRGWNVTALNAAADAARALLGLPSVADLNPDIAKIQDHARANRDARAALTTGADHAG